MKTSDSKTEDSTEKKARLVILTEEGIRERDAALAGIDPPSAGSMSKPDWERFTREVDALGCRPPSLEN